MTTTKLVSALAVLCSGIWAGVMIGVQVGVAPAERSLQGSDWIDAHRRLHQGFDPFQPILGGITILLALLLAALRQDRRARLLALAGGGLAGAAGAISELVNIPINEAVARWDDASPPPDWADRQSRWLRFHALRVACGLGAFLAIVAATAIDTKPTR
jgi:uncharacterized membrane protein